MHRVVPGAGRLLARCLSVSSLLGALVLAGVASAPPAAAGEDPGDGGSVGIGLLEAPTDRADDPRALVYVIDHLQPGDVIERRIEVTNTTGSAMEVQLYPAAATITDDGWTPLEGRTANHLSSWTTITPTSVSVPSGGATPATLKIAVPSDAVAGEHYAVAWAQLPTTSGAAVDVIHRVGIRLYVSVGDGAEPASDFTINAVRATTNDDGSRTLDVDVVNVGGRAIDISGQALLTGGPGGTTAGPFRSPAGPTIAPGHTGTLALPVPTDLPDGTWTAELTVRSGVLERDARVAVSWTDAGLGSVTVDPADVTGPPDDAADVEVGVNRPWGDAGTLAVSLLAAALILAVAAASLRTHRRQHQAA